MKITVSFAALLLTLLTLLATAAAQDVRGMEVCTAEKQMERRTGCLQANVEFLHQALLKQARESNERIAAVSRELAAARIETAALKTALAKLDAEVTQLKAKAEPAKK